VRIGLHTTTANRTGGGYKGKGVHEAARIAALADGEQIVASRETAAAAPAGVTMSESRTVTLRGLSAPVEIVAIDWR
jgi:class 3 adenylate cyclase